MTSIFQASFPYPGICVSISSSVGSSKCRECLLSVLFYTLSAISHLPPENALVLWHYSVHAWVLLVPHSPWQP